MSIQFTHQISEIYYVTRMQYIWRSRGVVTLFLVDCESASATSIRTFHVKQTLIIRPDNSYVRLLSFFLECVWAARRDSLVAIERAYCNAAREWAMTARRVQMDRQTRIVRLRVHSSTHRRSWERCVHSLKSTTLMCTLTLYTPLYVTYLCIVAVSVAPNRKIWRGERSSEKVYLYV